MCDDDGAGESLTESRAEIDYAASFIRWFAEEARRIEGDILTSLQSTQKLMVIATDWGLCRDYAMGISCGNDYAKLRLRV